MSDNTTPDRDELNELRHLAADLGMPGEIRPADHGIELESAANFVARMQRAEGESAPQALEMRSSRSNWRSLQIVAIAATTIGVALAVIFTPWNRPSAVADTPPVLSYQFAPATDIAFAPGKVARKDLLDLASAAASTKPAPAVGSVQYVQTDSWFVSREDIEKGSESELIPTVVQSWISPDGSQTIVETSGRPLRVDGRGLTPAEPPTTASLDQSFPPGNANADRMAELGTTAEAVRRELIRSAGCETGESDTARAQCLFQEITGLFLQHVVPPRTASLFWEVLADEPGFRSLGSVTDRAGRSGIGISVISSEAPEYRYVLVISPSTGQVLGTEEILIKSNTEIGLKAPAINSFSAILASRYVEDRPSAP